MNQHHRLPLGNLAVRGIDHLATIVKNGSSASNRPKLTDAFFAHTGLTLDLEPP